MLVFRSGAWRTVQVVLSDPLLTEGHRREAASMIAAKMDKGASLTAATAEAEKTLYLRLYPGLKSCAGSTTVSVLREEHGAPKN